MANKEKLNVVWFCTDQQRYDTIHSLGNPYIKTPNIDKLVDEGAAFTRAYTQSPVCTPSRSSFLTGRYPRTTKAFYNGNDNYSGEEKLVTKLLADAGYTCGLTGKLHLSAAQGRMEKRTDDGYCFMRWSHHPHDDWENKENDYQNWLKAKGIKWTDIYGGKCTSLSQWPPVINENFSGKEVGVPAEYHQTTWCVEEAINFMEQSKNNPWLVSINVFDPHPPLDPPQEYKDRLNVENMPLPLWQEGELDGKPSHQRRDYVQGGQDGATDSIIGMSDADKQEAVRDYYAQIELIDDQLGRLMNYLEKSGQKDNTVIIYMSDHGEMNGDHGLYWKGAYFYEQLVHVPLIISCPSRFISGVRCDALVELVDIAPTLMAMNGLEVPGYMQGKSLLPILTGAASPHHFKDAIYCEFYHALAGAHEDIYATMYFDGRYKLVSYCNSEEGELYDLQEDPNEYLNRWDDAGYCQLKNELIAKNFSQAVMNNMDFSMVQKYSF